jgi:hypothetical protein
MTTSNSLKSLLSNMFEESLKSSEYVSTLVIGVTNLVKQTTKLAEMMVRVQERLEEHERALLFLTEKHKKVDSLDRFSRPSEKNNKPN